MLVGPVLVGAVMVGVAAAALLVPAIPLPTTPGPVSDAVPVAARVARPQVVAVSIAIPSLDLSGPLDALGVADDGELLAPDDPSRAGWYAGGVVPGDLGPAIVGGHVDSRRGRGVFFALRSLHPGDVVDITRSDGRVARFSVSRVQQVAKDRFPTAAVYGPTAAARASAHHLRGPVRPNSAQLHRQRGRRGRGRMTTVRDTDLNSPEHCVRSAGLPPVGSPRESAQRHQRGPRHALPILCNWPGPSRNFHSRASRFITPEERSPR